VNTTRTRAEAVIRAAHDLRASTAEVLDAVAPTWGGPAERALVEAEIASMPPAPSAEQVSAAQQATTGAQQLRESEDADADARAVEVRRRYDAAFGFERGAIRQPVGNEVLARGARLIELAASKGEPQP
jgi:hypothetical protein